MQRSFIELIAFYKILINAAHKLLTLNLFNMDILRKKRLNHELMNGVTLQQLQDKLYNEIEILMDNDRLAQAIDAKKDLNIVNEWIHLDELNKDLYNDVNL